MKKYLLIIGGAGFVGSNLIELLLKKTNLPILSLDNYSSGTKKNHIRNKRVKYIKGHSKNIKKKLNSKKNEIHSIFHFGEFSRIYQSFFHLSECLESNSVGSHEVFKFCLDNNIKLIYSATSAALGKNNNKNLSPYAFTKAKNLEFLENLKKWFNFSYEIIYFYNVYGPRHISKGKMATVIGIFEDAYKKNLPMPVVLPGTQSRRFTHIEDTVDVCYEAWKNNKSSHYSISNKKSYSIKNAAKLFSSSLKYLPAREGERYASSLTKRNLSNNVIERFGKKSLKNYVSSFKKNNNKN